MSLIRWEPFSGADEVFARLPAVFGSWPRAHDTQTRSALGWKPIVDISETETEYVIRVKLPGNAHAANIRAESRDGLISVHLAKHKAGAKKPTEIKVR
jgi:HSP20 family molecular chaperone IbpA